MHKCSQFVVIISILLIFLPSLHGMTCVGTCSAQLESLHLNYTICVHGSISLDVYLVISLLRVCEINVLGSTYKCSRGQIDRYQTTSKPPLNPSNCSSD